MRSGIAVHLQLDTASFVGEHHCHDNGCAKPVKLHGLTAVASCGVG